MALPFDQLPIGEGLHPSGQWGASFFIDRKELEVIERDGPEWKFEDARFIDEAVKDPDAIFEGLRRPNQQQSLCYAVRPIYDPDDEDSQTLPRFGQVFLAFALLGVGGYVVFDWEWREEDPNFPSHPLNWQNDFVRPTWQRT